MKIIREIEAILQSKIKGLGKKSGRKYLLYTHGNRMIEMFLLKKEFKKSELKNKDFMINKSDISKSIDSMVSIMEDFIRQKYPDNFLATLFKNTTKCTEMDDYVNTKWE